MAYDRWRMFAEKGLEETDICVLRLGLQAIANYYQAIEISEVPGILLRAWGAQKTVQRALQRDIREMIGALSEEGGFFLIHAKDEDWMLSDRMADDPDAWYSLIRILRGKKDRFIPEDLIRFARLEEEFWRTFPPVFELKTALTAFLVPEKADRLALEWISVLRSSSNRVEDWFALADKERRIFCVPEADGERWKEALLTCANRIPLPMLCGYSRVDLMNHPDSRLRGADRIPPELTLDPGTLQEICIDNNLDAAEQLRMRGWIARLFW